MLPTNRNLKIVFSKLLEPLMPKKKHNILERTPLANYFADSLAARGGLDCLQSHPSTFVRADLTGQFRVSESSDTPVTTIHQNDFVAPVFVAMLSMLISQSSVFAPKIDGDQ